MNWEEIYGGIRAFAGRAATKINPAGCSGTVDKPAIPVNAKNTASIFIFTTFFPFVKILD